MAEPRLATEFWVSAHIKRLARNDIQAVLFRRGSNVAGQVLVKLNRLRPRDEEGCMVFVQSYDFEGNRVWRPGTGDNLVREEDADQYIQRTIKFDPDVWVLEIEDRAGRHMLEPVQMDGPQS